VLLSIIRGMEAKKIIWLVGAVLVVATAFLSYDLFFYSPKRDITSRHDSLPSEFKEDKPFLIAGLLPLSGDNAPIGRQTQELMKFAALEVERAGGVAGKKMELVFYDTECSDAKAQEAMSAARGLGVLAVIGGVCEFEGTVMSSLARSAGILSFSFNSSLENSKVTGINGLSFQMMPSYLQFAQMAIARISVGKVLDQPAKVVLVFSQGDYESISAATAFENYSRDKDVVISAKIELGKNKPLDVLDALRLSGARHIYMPLGNSDASMVLAAVGDYKEKIEIIGPYGWNRSVPVKFSDNITLVWPYPEMEPPRVLLERLNEAGIPEKPIPEAVRAYDVVKKLADVFTVSGRSVPKASERILGSSWIGVGEAYSFDEFGSLKTPKWAYKLK
jgi:ABC-type branched-subunit amino acid transport system substrate-binding protein